MKERLIWARQSAGFETAVAAAEAIGIPEQTYLAHENGSRGFRGRAEEYARRFKVNLEWLLTGRGKPKKGQPSIAHAVGEIGAGAEVLPFNDHSPGALEEVEIPMGVPEDAVLVVVRGDSMYPRYFEGERLFYERRNENPMEFINRECAIRLADGRMFVKLLRRGTTDNLFNLESWNPNTPTMIDQVVEWAAPVLARVNKGSR